MMQSVVGDVSPPQGCGEALRSAREQAGLSLQEVGQRLRQRLQGDALGQAVERGGQGRLVSQTGVASASLDEADLAWMAGKIVRTRIMADDSGVMNRSVLDADGDDNPDITKYMGWFELSAAYKQNDATWRMMLRNNLRSDNKGAVRLSYSVPLAVV